MTTARIAFKTIHRFQMQCYIRRVTKGLGGKLFPKFELYMEVHYSPSTPPPPSPPPSFLPHLAIRTPNLAHAHAQPKHRKTND